MPLEYTVAFRPRTTTGNEDHAGRVRRYRYTDLRGSQGRHGALGNRASRASHRPGWTLSVCEIIAKHFDAIRVKFPERYRRSQPLGCASMLLDDTYNV